MMPVCSHDARIQNQIASPEEDLRKIVSYSYQVINTETQRTCREC